MTDHVGSAGGAKVVGLSSTLARQGDARSLLVRYWSYAQGQLLLCRNASVPHTEHAGCCLQSVPFQKHGCPQRLGLPDHTKVSPHKVWRALRFQALLQAAAAKEIGITPYSAALTYQVLI